AQSARHLRLDCLLSAARTGGRTDQETARPPPRFERKSRPERGPASRPAADPGPLPVPVRLARGGRGGLPASVEGLPRAEREGGKRPRQLEEGTRRPTGPGPEDRQPSGSVRVGAKAYRRRFRGRLDRKNPGRPPRPAPPVRRGRRQAET